MQIWLGKKEETKCEWAAKGFLVLGPFSRRFSHPSVSWYNIPLIEFKVTLEMLTPKVKKNTEIYTIASKWVRMTSMILNTKYKEALVEAKASLRSPELSLRPLVITPFTRSGPFVWNKLPREIRNSQSVVIFKSKLKTSVQTGLQFVLTILNSFDIYIYIFFFI